MVVSMKGNKMKRFHDHMSSGSGKFANLPDQLKMNDIAEVHNPMPNDYDDSPAGVDTQIRADERKRNEIFKGRKA
jgi:hypothetical protein